jgi:hypothetical protein
VNEGEFMLSSEESALSWIGKHGSPRLKKAVLEQGGSTGILWKIYLIERLALELPEWKLAPRYSLLPIDSPFEAEEDMLAKAQKQFPEGNVRLSHLRYNDFQLCNDNPMPVLIMDCPWSKKDEIVFYIDKIPPRSIELLPVWLSDYKH